MEWGAEVLEMTLELPINLFLLWEDWNVAAGSNKIRKGFRLIWHAVVWNLWRVRNDRIFKNAVYRVEDTVEAVKVMSWRWFLSRLKVPACLFYE